MSRTGDWIIGIEEDAKYLSKAKFLKSHGESALWIWVLTNGEELEPTKEEMESHQTNKGATWN
jgi:hypothetical protein